MNETHLVPERSRAALAPDLRSKSTDNDVPTYAFGQGIMRLRRLIPRFAHSASKAIQPPECFSFQIIYETKYNFGISFFYSYLSINRCLGRPSTMNGESSPMISGRAYSSNSFETYVPPAVIHSSGTTFSAFAISLMSCTSVMRL